MLPTKLKRKPAIRVSETDSDDDSSDGNETNEAVSWALDSIVNSKKFDLGLYANYTDWSPQEAFRELVQNWYRRLYPNLVKSRPIFVRCSVIA